MKTTLVFANLEWLGAQLVLNMTELVEHVVIVGGGSAGWLTAGIIAAEHKKNGEPGLRVTLVESPDVNTIGVGEGTWPSMRTTLRKLGISETEFLRTCSASFKQGSKFVGWRNGRSNDYYYHPFSLPQGYGECNTVSAWRQSSQQSRPFANAVTPQPSLCEAALAPKQTTTPEYAGVVNYGYHLDAAKFVELLQRHCVEQLGVTHISDHILDVIAADDGYISALLAKNTGLISADLFVDCTGSSCLLLGKHLGVQFCDKQVLSINDSALAISVPYESEFSGIASATIATAQSAGWTWDIGLSSRKGVGYVYSSAHISDEAAEQELRAHVAATNDVNVDALAVKKIKFRAGHREKFWEKNCVAVGMAAGFIEPLEASALALVELSANMIRDELPCTRDDLERVGSRFNNLFHYRWERILEFLKLHYVLSERKDTDYWVDSTRRDTMPAALQELLAAWRYRVPGSTDFIHAEEIFPSASYLYVLYGMHYRDELHTMCRHSDNLELARRYLEEVREKSNKFLAGLPTNRALLNFVHKQGFQTI